MSLGASKWHTEDSGTGVIGGYGQLQQVGPGSFPQTCTESALLSESYLGEMGPHRATQQFVKMFP